MRRHVALILVGAAVGALTHRTVVRADDAPRLELVAEFRGHTRPVAHLFFSDDGKTLIASIEDGTVRFWTIPELKGTLPAVVEPSNDDTIRCAARGYAPFIAMMPDRKTLLVGDELARPDKGPLVRGHTCLRYWDIATRKERPVRDRPVVVECLLHGMSPDGKYLIHGEPKSKNGVRLFERATGKLHAEFPCGEYLVDRIISSDGKLLVVAAIPDVNKLKGELTVWDIGARKLQSTISLMEPVSFTGYQVGRCLGFMPGGKKMVALTSGGLLFFELPKEKPVDSQNVGAQALAYSRDGRFLATVGSRAVNVWGLDSYFQPKGDRLTRNGLVRRIVFSPDGEYVAIGTDGRQGIELWAIRGSK